MRALGYVRVSTQDQAIEGVSMPAQETKIRQYADLYGIDLVGVIRDAGVSAKTLDRPGLREALEALEAGDAEALIIVKLDRLTRSVRDLGDLLDGPLGKAGGKALVSVQDQFDTSTAQGRLGLNLLTSVAQWEREAIGERTAAAIAHKLAIGEHVGAVPYGSRMDGKGGRLVPADEERRVISRAVELRAGGLTLQAIADTFNREGIATKRGGSWYACTIRNLLTRAGREVA